MICNKVDANTLSSPGNNLRWYLIHCKPRQDERASENLVRQSFHCYRPVRQVERRRADFCASYQRAVFEALGKFR